MAAGAPTSDAAREQLEAEIRACCNAGEYDRAATAAIKGYGPEIYGFLVTLHSSEDEAADVFSIVTENLWRGLPGFTWQASLRTWLYTIARHASSRRRKVEQRHRGASPIGELASKLAAEVRTETRAFLRTDHRDALSRLRDELPPEDRALLVLRVDRDLAWNDLARVLLEDEREPDEATLKREAARLRKRFQLVKERLVARGRQEGLLPGSGDP
jgi:RNA polymerase sigma-70 factor (ECF subfamily)